MSEYQYYEFQAIDRPLDAAAQQALRSISSRARITATSFANHYDWGDLKGDPRNFMERWFDLHLYLANWGSRRLIIRLPKRLCDRRESDAFVRQLDWVEVWTSGDNLIVDIHRDEVELDEWDDGSGWLAALAPLRANVLSGDLRLFYLLWLTAVEDDLVSDTELEPLPGIGPLTGALEGFADFFGIDPGLVQAAAESGAEGAAISKDHLRQTVGAIAPDEKTELLLRVIEGDGHVAADLKRRILQKCTTPRPNLRTVGELRRRAREIREAYERAEIELKEAERRRQAEQAEKARRARLVALRQRGERVWREIEDEIGRRNASSYDRAAGLISDLQTLAVEEGSQDDFARRLASIRVRHERKGQFIERLIALGLFSGDR
ncbi:MAG: hypothetical protein JO139_18515 [Alphaproteobacteria bacterium]|nr:hypothetical protein [Alphaproteobacteria bacterium]